jgi:hypothetical protein
MNPHALKIHTAQQNILIARAALEVFTERLNSDFPAPDADCDDATFSAWNDAYEQANMDRGGPEFRHAKTAAETALLDVFAVWMRSLKSAPQAVIEVLDMVATRYTARVKVLELAMKLDARTLWMVS